MSDVKYVISKRKQSPSVGGSEFTDEIVSLDGVNSLVIAKLDGKVRRHCATEIRAIRRGEYGHYALADDKFAYLIVVTTP